jgi:hypothetical protein
MGQRIESGNAAINRELAQQGATIAEVLRVIHVRVPFCRPFYPSVELLLTCGVRRLQDINAGLRDPCFARETVKIALPLTLADAAAAAAGPPPTPTRMITRRSPDGSLRVRMASRWWPPTPTPTLPKAKVIIGTGTPEPEAKSKPAAPPRRRLSLTQKCGVKMVPLANVLSKLSSSFSLSSHSPSRGAAAGTARDSPCGARSSVTPQLISASSSSCCPLPAEPPPPYQLRVANPAPEYDDGSAAPRSSSRFTAASVEAVRAPDSPVPTFPSPKLSTESVFGSTQSLASVSAGNGSIAAEPRCTRRNTAARGAGPPILRRKETIKFGVPT